MESELFRLLKRGGIIIQCGDVDPILTRELKQVANFGEFNFSHEGVYEKQ